MKCFNTNDMIFIDVDNTLVMHNHEKHNLAIDIPCPYIEHLIHELVPNECHIRLLKNCKAQGKRVIVWSAQGWKWAETVVIALGIEKYVDLCMGKPHIIVDDKPWAEWPICNLYLKSGFGK